MKKLVFGLVVLAVLACNVQAGYVEFGYYEGKCASSNNCCPSWVDNCSTGFGLYPITFGRNLLYLPLNVLSDVTDCAASLIYRK